MTVAARLSRAIALLLLAWQALLVQTHWHARAPAAPALVSVAASTAASTAPQRPENPADCPVCREVAHAGQYLSPGPLLFHAPAIAAPWLFAVALPILDLVRRSPAWRSRAPPTLHA